VGFLIVITCPRQTLYNESTGYGWVWTSAPGSRKKDVALVRVASTLSRNLPSADLHRCLQLNQDVGLGPVPLRKEKTFQRGQIRAVAGNERHQCQGSEENRGHARVRVWNTSVLSALACRIHFYYGKRVKWRSFLPPETFPAGTVPRSSRRVAHPRAKASRESRSCTPENTCATL
jgi:hypothetical protein